MVSTRSSSSSSSTPKRPAAAAASSPPSSTSSSSRAQQASNPLSAQIASAIPSLPTLDDAPPLRAARSHLVLASLVCAVVFLGWVLGFDLLQVSGGGRQNNDNDNNNNYKSWLDLAALLGAFAVVLLAALHWLGLSRIDFWQLIRGFWWLVAPAAVAAVAALTLMQERATGLHEVE